MSLKKGQKRAEGNLSLKKLRMCDAHPLQVGDTTDKGFTEYRSVRRHGALIVRLRPPNRYKIHNAVMHVIERFPMQEWPNLLVVVRDTTMSISRTGRELS